MADLLVLVLIGGFFALAVLLVRGCEKLLGATDAPLDAPSTGPAPDPADAARAAA